MHLNHVICGYSLEVVLKVVLAIDVPFSYAHDIIEQQSSFSHLVLFFAILNSSFDNVEMLGPIV